MEKKDKTKPSRIAKITSPKPAAKPKKSSSLSPAMSTWAKANRKMIEKSGTKKQRAILAQVDKGKTKGVGPVKSGSEYGRSLNKGKSTPLPKSARNTSTSSTPKDKPAVKPKVTSKPKTKPSSQANKGSGRDGSFGAGTYGSGRESDRANALKMRSIKQPYQGNFPGTPKAEQQTQSSRKPLTPAQRRAARRGSRKPKDKNKKNRSTFPGRLF